MLGINCLIRNPQIQKDLRDIVNITGNELAADRGSAKINEVYDVLRRAGVELDIQTLSHIYEDVFDMKDPTFSTQDAVEKARQESFRKLANLQPKVVTQTIGRDKPSVAAAANVMRTLIDNIPDKTAQRVMQDRLTKAAKRILGIKSPSTAKTFEEIVQSVLQTETPSDFHGMGAMDNARSLFNEMTNELESEGLHYNNAELVQYSDILRDATYDTLASQGEINKMVTDTMKQSGYTKEVNTNGTPKSVIDWDKIISDKPDYKSLFRSVLTAKGISADNADNLTDVLDRQYKDILAKKIDAKLEAKNQQQTTPEQKRAIDKLVELDDLNIFNQAQQMALAKVAGLSNLNTEQVQHLRNILTNYKAGMQIPMAEFSPTFIKTMQRQVENFIETFENKSTAVSIMSKIQSYMQFSNAAILANPQNVIENALSGAIEANIVTGIINPGAFIKSLSDFTNKFADYAKGGVRVGEERGSAFNRSGNIEDLYNAETKSGKRPDVILSTIPRLLLGASDNGFKHQIAQSLINKTLHQALEQQGATKEEAHLIMNDIYYGNNDQLADIARQLSGKIVAAGVHTGTTTSGDLNLKEKVIQSELALANMQTEGRFFQSMLSDMISDGKISAALKDKLDINVDMLKAIRASAYNTASKGLGHEADNMLLELFETRYDKINKKIEDARKSGESFNQAKMMLLRSVLAGVNKFRQGGFNWVFLGLQKSTGLSLLQTLITDVALGNKRGIPLKFSQIDLHGDKAEEQLSKYMALRQRLVRETVPVIGALGVSAAMIAMIKGSGTDEEKKRRAKEFNQYLNSHPGMNRWFNKISPQIAYNWIENINATTIDKLPEINAESAAMLKENGITDVSLSNLDQVSELLNLDDDHKAKLEAAVATVNKNELPGLFVTYLDPTNVIPSLKNNVQPNPAVQMGVDLFDVRKPDKEAVVGTGIANILNLGGVMRSYDIWKNSIANPEKIPGEYKLIKPHGLVEGFMYQTLNKDLYKKFFVSDADVKLQTIDLPAIGKKGVQTLADEGINEVTPDNLDEVGNILNLNDDKKQAILDYMDYHNKLVEKVMGKKKP